MESRVKVRYSIRRGEEAHVWRKQGLRGILKLVAEIFKLRIVTLLLWAAFAGAFLGAGGAPGLNTTLLLLLTGGMAAAGASGLNQYLERGIDAEMPRTRNRPLVRGSIENPDWILWISMAMILAAVLIALLLGSASLAFFLLLGAGIYVGMYTLWLKPKTILNIVIGGAAGSAAVLSGGAAVGAWQDPFVIALALLVFLWTPAHFWSLSLLHRSDYQRAGFPMLPAVTTAGPASVWVLIHASATGTAGIALAAHPRLGWLYLMVALTVTSWFLWNAISLVRQPDPARAGRTFMASNLYLSIILTALMVGLLI